MSTSKIIYENILNSSNFSGSFPSPNVQEYHKGIIDVFLNYQSGSTILNLWDKLDFFYFFDTDNESLRFINWKNPNSITASIGNDNFSPSYNYSYLGPAQDQIAKWWDGLNTPFGNSGSIFNDGTISYAWKQSTLIAIELSDASGSQQGSIKQYTLNGVIPTNGTGSFPDTYVNSLTQTFDYYPYTSSFNYEYKVDNGYLTPDRTEFQFYLNSNQVLFNNISGDTNIYNGNSNYLSGSNNNSMSNISVQVLQSPLRHRITVAYPQKPPTTTTIVTSLVTSKDSFNSRVNDPFSIGYENTFDPKNTYGKSYNLYYWIDVFQNWILNNNYLVGKVSEFKRYPNYYQALTLNNGTYFNTNFNIKQNATNYTLNDGFIGFLKIGPAGGVMYSNDSQPTPTVNTISGSLYVGIADSENSNNSLAIKLNKQYFHNATGSDAKNYNTGFQAGLGLSLSSSYKETDYAWKAYSGSNPFPYQSTAIGNQDNVSSYITASNVSSRSGRPGLYIAQRHTSSITTAHIKQYYNNLLTSSSSLDINTENIPDGNFYLNGLGSPTYVDSGYVSPSSIQSVTKSLGIITSVSSGSYFGTTTYTSSALISNITSEYTNVLTYFTGLYNTQTGFGESNSRFNTLPSSTVLYNDFTIVYRIENSNVNLPNVNDEIHIGYGNNSIGYVKSTQQTNYSEYDYYDYTVIGTATKTTGSGINSGNSTIVRFYESNYVNIGSALNSRTRKTLYNTVISGSGLYTISSRLDKSFLINPTNTQVINYPFNGTNGFPTQSINIISGSELGLVVSSSSPIFEIVGLGINYKLSFPFGNQIYSGSEFGATFYTRFTGSYTTSSNNLETIFITDNIGNTVFNNNTFLSNGNFNLTPPSVSGSSFNFQYSGSTESSLLSGLNINNIFKITVLNPEYNSPYFTPYGQDIKQSPNQSDSFILTFGGGNVGNTNLKFIYRQLYNLILARTVSKITYLPILNYTPFVLSNGELYYTSDTSIQNIYPTTVNYPVYIPSTKESKTSWDAITDIQSNTVGKANINGTNLHNPFNI